MTAQELEAQAVRINWWHTIDLGQGVTTKGQDPTPARLPWLGIPEDLRGKSVLDIGAWDGFFSFECERRGASRVLATDDFVWTGQTWASKDGFDFARRALNSRVEDLVIGVYDLSAERIGTFDLVLFSAVLYHLKHPWLALERVADVTGGQLIMTSHIDLVDVDRPAIALYPGTELGGDPTNWCGPNIPALEAMLRTVGFRRIEVFALLAEDHWVTLHAWK